jgi:membrane protease YdiL (CAAX protease family)
VTPRRARSCVGAELDSLHGGISLPSVGATSYGPARLDRNLSAVLYHPHVELPPPVTADAPPLAVPPELPRARLLAAPRVWPSLLAPVIAMIGAVFASAIGVLVVAALSDPGLMKGNFAKNLEHWFDTHIAWFPAIFASLVPSQVVFIGTAIFFATVDRERWYERLGFVRWKVPSSLVVLAILGMLGVQFATGLVADRLIREPSSSLKMMARMFTEPQGLAAVGVGLLMSVLPGVCEEALFRGFTQRGLLRRWSPAVAIGVTSIYFALAHFDVQHSIAVIPLGVWLGFVAWKTGSVWASALCHFTNNAVAFVVLRVWGDTGPEGSRSPVYYVAGVVCVVITVLAAVRLQKIETSPCVRA